MLIYSLLIKERGVAIHYISLDLSPKDGFEQMLDVNYVKSFYCFSINVGILLKISVSFVF